LRIGHNPLRASKVDELPTRIMSVITHLPNRKGYHQYRLDVIKACLESMRYGAPGIPVMVWDNGSCSDLTDWLLNEYKPETLILSPNVGKSNARMALFRMVSPNTIMALSDDDMLFYPGWFDACQKLIETFPEVGKVSCYPVRTQGRWGCSATKAWAAECATLEKGVFVTEEEERDFCTSVERDYDWHMEYAKNDIDHRVTYKGLQAYCYAHHCQFMARAGVIVPFLERTSEAMANEKPFDNAVNDAGLLQLTTAKRYSRHIGNMIDHKVIMDMIGMGLLSVQEVANG
jgi:glycosyltransferase involved in cell wall biosynthesis